MARAKRHDVTLPPGIDLHMTGKHRAILTRAQRAFVGRQGMWQHRNDTVGEIDAVAALRRFTVERAPGADIVTDIGNGDDGLEATWVFRVVIRCRPDRIVEIACITRIDGDDRQMAQVFAMFGV